MTAGMRRSGGGVTFTRGFSAWGISAGIKQSRKPDLALLDGFIDVRQNLEITEPFVDILDFDH